MIYLVKHKWEPPRWAVISIPGSEPVQTFTGCLLLNLEKDKYEIVYSTDHYINDVARAENNLWFETYNFHIKKYKTLYTLFRYNPDVLVEML